MAALVQMPAGLDPARCPRIKSDGKQCGNRAGKATTHLGAGYCFRHGGASPNGEKHGAKLLAIAIMRDAGEIDVNPLDAMLYTVRRASHLAALYRLQREAAELEFGDGGAYVQLEREALADLNQWSDRAIKAGVAERQVRIAERMGERLSAAFEGALATGRAMGLEIPHEILMAMIGSYSGELARHEGGGDIQVTAKDV